MAKPQRPRSEFAPGQPIVLEMVPVPKEGQITVQFLANPLGVLIHQKNEDDRYACAGPGECRPEIHRLKVIWKGYAPALRRRPAPYSDWIPCVFEVTRSLAHLMGTDPVRGQVWRCWRAKNRYDRMECTGDLLETLSPSDCPIAFDVQPVVYRVYHTVAILFGAPDPMPPREVVQPVKGYTPPGEEAAPMSADEQKADQRRAMETLRAALKPTPPPPIKYT